MAKITPEAADAMSKALKPRSIKRIDVGDKFTTTSRVTYDDKGKVVSNKILGSIKHG